jgi:hypothetical protein
MNIIDNTGIMPNLTDINAHLHALFSPAFVHPYPDAWIEIAYAKPDGKLANAENIRAFDLKDAAEFAMTKSRAGFNVYVAPALRQGKQPRSGRATDQHVLASAYAWAEYDGAGDDERVQLILKEKQLSPALTVVTGTVPHRRAHLYFRLADGVTDAEQLRKINTSLCQVLGGDAVQSPSHVMRLAGTVSYPTPNKQARGYVAELVTLHVNSDAESYRPAALIGLAPTTGNPFLDFANRILASVGGRSDDELRELLERSRTPQKWHNSMRDAVASMVGQRWTDGAIKLSCAPYCKEGADDPDLTDLIDSARRKWPGDAETSEHQEASLQPSSHAIPLSFYNDAQTVIAKQWILKGIIARGETSSWIAPPGKGKSALLTELAVCVASGSNWRGHRSKEHCGVVYFALERGDLVRRRLAAHAKRTGEVDLPIAVASRVIDLMSPKCVAIAIDTIRAAEFRFGCSVGMVIIDTYAKGIAIGGGDEDKAKDQNKVLAHLRKVQEAVNIHIALIGHTGKDEGRGARGSNAHDGDVDVIVQIKGDSTIKTAEITKANDLPNGVLTRFKLEVAELGVDEDGDNITVAVVAGDEASDEQEDKGHKKLTKTQRRAMELLVRCINDEGKPGPTSSLYPRNITVVPMAAWRQCCERGALSGSEDRESRDKAFRRARDDLLTMHRISVWDDLVWIAYHDG